MGKRRLSLFYRLTIVFGSIFVISLLLSVITSFFPIRPIFTLFVIIIITSALSALGCVMIGFLDSRYSRSLESDLYAYIAMLKGFKFDPFDANQLIGIVLCVVAVLYFFFLFAFFFDWGKNCTGSDECCMAPGTVLILLGTGFIFKEHFRERMKDLYFIQCRDCGTFTPIVADGKISTIKCRDCGRKEALDPAMDRMAGRKLRTCPKCQVRTFKSRGSTCPYCRSPFSIKKLEENEKKNTRTIRFERTITIEKNL